MGKADYTKHLFADSLRDLLTRKSYRTVTVSDIARNCGLSRHTFYYHFKDKQDLVQWIYLDSRSQSIKITNAETLRGNCHRLLEKMQEDARLYSQIRYDDSQNGFRESYFSAGYHCFLKLFRSYLGERKVDPVLQDFIARFFTYAGSEVTLDVLEGISKISDSMVIDLTMLLLEKGLYSTLDILAEAAENEFPKF